MAYGQYTGLGAINREGLLKKNPLLGKAFGAGTAGQESKREYQDLHSYLREGISAGKVGEGQGKSSLEDLARQRYGSWSAGKRGGIEEARGLASKYQGEVQRDEGAWNRAVETRARLESTKAWGDMLGMSGDERSQIKGRMKGLSDQYGLTPQGAPDPMGGWSEEDKSSWLSDKQMLADDVKRGGSAGIAARRAENVLLNFQNTEPALARALAGSREALAYQQNKITGGEAELRKQAGLYNSFFGGY